MLSDRKKLVLGTKPVLLRPFRGLGQAAPDATAAGKAGACARTGHAVAEHGERQRHGAVVG